MKKKLFVTVIIVMTIYVSQSQSTWQIVNPPLVEDFSSVCFTDAAHGWIISENGTIVSTSNAGITWQTLSSPEYHFENIHFADENHGCVVGWNTISSDSSIILMTDDGGNTWSEATHPNATYLFDVFFINNNIGWIVGWNYPSGWILYTDDSGITWTRQMTVLGVSGELYGVHFRDETHGHICGVNAMFLHTNNGGTIGNGWALNISIPTLEKDLYSLYDFGELQGCAVGADGIVIYTVDNWANWIQMNSNITDTLWSITNVEGTQNLWAVGNNGTIIHNQMFILPWEIQESNVTENLNDICMISETNGWAVGDNGTILHFSPTTSISHPDEYKIEVYPNPVDNLLYIHMDSPLTFNQIQIINSTGKLVCQKRIENSLDSAVDVSNLAPGIYHLKIIGDSETIIKKVLIR